MKPGRLAAIGLVLMPFAVTLAIISGGGGHGNYGFARALFPIPLLMTRLTRDTITRIVMIAAVLQFPIYGWILDVAARRNRAALAAALVALVHCIGLALCFSGVLLNFT